MPDYPYSDNMYSALEDSDTEEQPLEYLYGTNAVPADGNRYTPGRGHEYGYGLGAVEDADDSYHHAQRHEEDVLSPTDGYFGRSGSAPSTTSSAYPSDPYSTSSQDQVHAAASTSPSTSGYAAAASSRVPHVPNVWVSDPTIEQGSTAESKAREAQEEREINSRHRAGQLDNSPSQTPTTHATRDGGSSASAYPSSQSSTSGPGHPRYGYGPGLSSAGSYAQRYTPSTSTALSRPQRSGTIYSERSSLFSEAPPAYTPSPTSPTNASSSHHSNNNNNNSYQTFPPPSNMGRISESESQGLLTGHQDQYHRGPQDMGGERGGHDHSTFPRVGDWRDRARCTGRACKLFVLGLVLLFVAAGFLVSSFVSVEDEKKTHIPGGGNPGHGGSGSSPIGKMPAQDGHGTRLAYPAFDGEMPWAEGRHCADSQIKYPIQTFDIDFSTSHSLSLVQDIKKDHHNHHNGQVVHVSGDVVVRRAGRGTPGPSITLEVVSNDDQIQPEVTWDHTSQELHVRTPPSIPRPNNSGTTPCLQIRATIWAPPDSALDTLDIETVHLGVQLLDNLSLRLSGGPARITSTSGSVVAAADGENDAKQLLQLLRGGGTPPASFRLDSRRVEVKTVSGTIAGSWPLYDYLGLQTVSGTVRAGVQPKEALAERPLPAVLHVRTTSGAVEVYEPVAEAAALGMEMMRAGGDSAALAGRVRDVIPPRQYDVDLYTMSGTVRGSLAFGASCRVHTTSGNIDLDLLPVLDRSQVSSSPSSVLETATTSGTTVINVLDALWTHVVQTGPYEASPPSQQETSPPYSSSYSSTPAIRVLDSRHSTTSAPIRLSYPPAWEGAIDADTLSGSLDVSGRGVEIIRREEEFPGYKKHVLARKGPEGGGGSLACHSISGSITVGVRS